MRAKYNLNVVYTDNSQKNFKDLCSQPYQHKDFLLVHEDNRTHNINLQHVFGYTVEEVK